jgi:hypothetical protein
MTKFKYILKRDKIAAWNEAYINYKLLCNLLKPITILNDNMLK